MNYKSQTCSNCCFYQWQRNVLHWNIKDGCKNNLFYSIYFCISLIVALFAAHYFLRPDADCQSITNNIANNANSASQLKFIRALCYKQTPSSSAAPVEGKRKLLTTEPNLGCHIYGCEETLIMMIVYMSISNNIDKAFHFLFSHVSQQGSALHQIYKVSYLPIFPLFYVCTSVYVCLLKKHIQVHVSKQREIHKTALLEAMTVNTSTTEDFDILVNNCVLPVMCLPTKDQCISLPSCFFPPPKHKTCLIFDEMRWQEVQDAALSVCWNPFAKASVVILVLRWMKGREWTYHYQRTAHHKEKIKDKVYFRSCSGFCEEIFMNACWSMIKIWSCQKLFL